MERLRHYIFVRHAHNWRLLFRFGVVGLTGVVINLVVTVICNKIGPDEDHVFVGLPFTDFNVRWYHVFSTIAFLIANLWNFQLNRAWTFRTSHGTNSASAPWPRSWRSNAVPRSASMSTNATVAPCAASWVTNSAPRPEAPPLTNAVRPRRLG